MKVLMIGPARSVNGGISAVVNNYYKVGIDKSIMIDYLPTMKDGSKLIKLMTAILALIRFPAVIRRYDCVHIHMSSDISLYRKLIFINLTKFFGKKLIIHQHGGDFKNFYYNSCSKRRQVFICNSLKKADYFLVVAPHLKELFKNILDEKEIIYLPNAIQIPANVRPPYGSHRILFLGRLCRDKGIGELLEAVKDLKEEFPDLQLILGGMWEDSSLKQEADKLSDFVYQPGWITGDEKEEYLRSCPIFVLPTYFEGMPISLLEAMSYKMAVVATKVGSIPEVLHHERNGLLIEAGDVNELKKKLKLLLSSENLQEKLGRQARKTVEEDFNIRNNVEVLLNIYKALEKES